MLCMCITYVFKNIPDPDKHQSRTALLPLRAVTTSSKRMIFPVYLPSSWQEAIYRHPEMEVVCLLRFLRVAAQAAIRVPELSSAEQKAA